MPATKKNTLVLIIEDNPDHAELTALAIERSGGNVDIFTVDNGEKAVDYLNNAGEYSDRDCFSRPDLILLDVKLPGINGIDVLKIIKDSIGLRMIPVVMLTTSDRPEDINEAYLHYANSFLTKPVGHKAFMQKIADLKHYWTSVNEPPSKIRC